MDCDSPPLAWRGGFSFFNRIVGTDAGEGCSVHAPAQGGTELAVVVLRTDALSDQQALPRWAGLESKRNPNMVDRNLLREFDVSEEELTAVVTAEDGSNDFDRVPRREGQNFEIGWIVSGKVIEVVGDQVVVDVGYKSEGLVPLNEWEDEPPPQPGDAVEVLLEGMEDETGEIVLSRKKAHRMRAWEMVISKYHEGDVVKGKVTRKIKGGLLVDIGVNVFLPASQVDIRRPCDIADYIDQEIECMILKIDESRRNIVVSPPQADRDHPRAAEEAAPRRDRAGPGPQGHGQEHRRLRRVRRPRRHRRPAAHHRHELGPDQPPQRHGQDRRPDRGDGPARRQGPREDRPGPQAEDAPARGRTSPTSTRSAPASWARSSTS